MALASDGHPEGFRGERLIAAILYFDKLSTSITANYGTNKPNLQASQIPKEKSLMTHRPLINGPDELI